MYKTFEAMKKELGEATVLAIVNKALEQKGKQASYHKLYNARKQAVVREIKAVAQAQGLTTEQLLAKVAGA